MEWKHKDVSLQIDTVWTGERAYERVERIFGSLWRSLQVEDDDSSSVAKLMPNVAVVTGTMELALPDDNDF